MPIDELPTTAAPAAAAPTPAPEAPVTAPVETVAPAAPAAPEFKPHTETKTLLQEAGDPAPEPASDPAKTEPAKTSDTASETKPAEAAPDAPPPEPAQPEPIAYPELKLPDGIQADREKIAALDAILGKNRIAPEVRQELADLHAQSLKAFVDNQQSQWHKAFADVRRGWVTESKADPQIGGTGHDTAMKAIARMRDAFVSRAATTSKQYQADRAAFENFLATTGAGDHPAFLKFIHNVARFFDEPALPPPDARPPPNNGRDPKASRRAVLYDNPSSQTAR